MMAPFIGINSSGMGDTDEMERLGTCDKLDPDKQAAPGAIGAIATSGTDALMLSGTLNVNEENLTSLQKQVKAYDLPIVMEPAGPDAVLMQGIDYVFVPSVMNTTDVQWLVGKHCTWVRSRNTKFPGNSSYRRHISCSTRIHLSGK